MSTYMPISTIPIKYKVISLPNEFYECMVEQRQKWVVKSQTLHLKTSYAYIFQ